MCARPQVRSTTWSGTPRCPGRLGLQRADRARPEHLPHADRAQRPEVRAVVHPVRREPVVAAVPGEERDPAPADLADRQRVAGRAEWRLDARPARPEQGVESPRDLTRYTDASFLVPTLQAALDNWSRVSPHLAAMAESSRRARSRPALPRTRSASPLPRAYQWADGSAYVNHVALVRKARGAKMPESFWTDPLMYQGGSDSSSARAMPSR